MIGIDRAPHKRKVRPYTVPDAGPRRQFGRALIPIGQVHPHYDMTPLVHAISSRIINNRHATVAGSYMLGDPGGMLYVLPVATGNTEHHLRKHEDWLIGSYAMDQVREDVAFSYPSESDLMDDIRAHYVKMFPAMLYEAIRKVEG